MGINVLSLCDGISCGREILKEMGVNVSSYRASEIQNDSMIVATHNHPDIIEVGDVTKLDDDFLKSLPKIDLLIGGTPCQGLSRAKNGRLNLDDPRSRLFYEYVRIKEWLLENNNPNLEFFLENVKPDKDTLEIMNEEMKVFPIELNSDQFSAQRRIRLYWTNINGGDIPLPEYNGNKIQDIIYDDTYGIFKDERIEKTKVFTKNYVKWDISGKGYWSQQDRAYYKDGTMCTLMKNNACNKLNIYMGDDTYRRCHPIEGERLQGLPDNYTEIIKSANKRLGLVGDGWNVPTVKYIFGFSKVISENIIK